MAQAFKLVAVLAGFFLLVPGFIWLTSGSRREAVESAKGYGWVVLILFVIPGALGGIVAGISLLFPH